MRVAVVIPNWNGARWLEGCLDSLAVQTRTPDEVLVVDGASGDESVAIATRHGLRPRVERLTRNGGFAVAANHGIALVRADAVALVNTDVVLDPRWLEGTLAALKAHPDAAAVATKMVALDDAGRIDDTGDVLRRDGVAEQRGRFRRDTGQWDTPGTIWGACAGAALYRRSAVLEVGGFDERYFMYLEDVDLALRLRLAGWTCRYEPVVARHAGAGSAVGLSRPVSGWVARNTVLLVAKAFPKRWAPLVAYRQLAWAWHAARERRLRVHVAGLLGALPELPAVLRERRRLRSAARTPIAEAVPARPLRGRRAGGHRASPE